MKKKSQYPTNEVFERIFSSVSAAEKSSFTGEQLFILHQACQKLAPRKHLVDLRLSIPVPFTSGIYFVILAGSEQRSVQRITKERHLFSRFMYLFLGSLGLVGILMLRLPILMTHMAYITHPQSKPTSLPWITQESDCVGSDRFWEEDACWDRQHDASF